MCAACFIAEPGWLGGACSHPLLELVFPSCLQRCISLLQGSVFASLVCLHHRLGSQFQPAKPRPCLLTSPAELPRPETPASQPCAKVPNKTDESGLVAIWRSIAARAQTCISVSILNHAASLAWQPVRITHSLDLLQCLAF